MDATTVGVDLAKNVFEITLADERRHIVARQRLSRARSASLWWTLAARPITTPDG